ncbi:MAG: CRISPR-associated protein Csn1, partial [Bacteroidetes bacterium]
YKLWLEQGYVSPYTGKVIPLSQLFTKAYQIEHIIPQSRYFDNSSNNKVICESAVNQLKDNQTAYEFIQKMGGSKVDLGNGTTVDVLKWEDYEAHCKTYFKNNRIKLKNLLREEIPEGFINRQINDSRYISKLIKSLLSNIVREEGEQESTAKRLLPVTGSITAQLRNDWGLNDKWNQLILPRFKRLNALYKTDIYTRFVNGKEVPNMPDELKANFDKKRIDHRHHALDALVVACCTRDHVSYINSINSERNNYSLVSKLRRLEEVEKNDPKTGERKKVKVAKEFLKPWQSFPADALQALETTVVSYKKNTRVLTKANNKYWKFVVQKDGFYKKQLVKQKGKNFAIRKSLHTPLPYGKRKYNFT